MIRVEKGSLANRSQHGAASVRKPRHGGFFQAAVIDASITPSILFIFNFSGDSYVFD
jgi:hypothetical protein